MPRICAAIVSRYLIVIWFSYSKPGECAALQTMKTIVLSEGSVPPVFAESFACIHELDNKPFSSPLIQDCVAKLKANYFIQDVKVRTEEMDDGRWVSVEFVLSSWSPRYSERTRRFSCGVPQTPCTLSSLILLANWTTVQVHLRCSLICQKIVAR